jgi:LytS/YehU family sensor histidine kinase
MIQLEEEIERLRNYLDLEQERLENKFEYYIEIEDSFEEYGVYIPSMIIQPFAENSIWHGISTIEEKGVIRIFFQAFSPTSLKIIVEDNGIGIKKSMEYADKGTHHQRLGILLIKKRLELLGKKFKTETSIDFSEYKPGHENPGTHVVLIVPFLTKISDL